MFLDEGLLFLQLGQAILTETEKTKLEFNQYHFAFLYESRIWLGANNIAAISNRIDLLIIPLNKNKTEGITDSASALNMLLFLKQIIQIAQYNTTNIVSTIRYMANASSDHHPNHVPGMLIIIEPKQPNLPICSATSINLLLHLFSKPSLHLIAKIILGIIMTAIIISPNIFNQSIYSSVNSDLSISYSCSFICLKRTPRFFVVWHGKSSVEIILSELIIPFFDRFSRTKSVNKNTQNSEMNSACFLFTLSIGRFRWILKISL